MEEEEVFDLANMNDYDLVSNEDGTVLIQDNCVVIRHKESQVMKLLPLSEDVLQALGLALVIDEDDAKKDQEEQQPSQAEEPSTKVASKTLGKDEGHYEADIIDDSNTAESEAADGITIVFTDDEDAGCNNTEQNVNRTKHLAWTDDMVNHLLELYEQHLPLFSRSTRSQRGVWKSIHYRMQTKYPQLKKYNENHLHIKFKGLQKTYKGAMMYWKENLHRTNWVHFEKMHKLMNKPLPPDAGFTLSSPTHEFKSKPDDNINQYFASAQWKPAWLKLTLDVMQKRLRGYHRGQPFWKEVHSEVIKMCPDFDVVSPECIEKKMYFLKKTYKDLQRRPQLKRRGEFSDKYFGQRVMQVFANIDDSDMDQDDPELFEGPWTANLISRFLDLCYEHQYKIASGSLPVALSKLASELGVNISQKELVHMYHTLKNKYNQLSAEPHDVRPKYYIKLQRIFQVQDGWDKNSTIKLLDLYAKVRLTLDESGARFWSELSERFNRLNLGAAVTPRRCEVKINSLLTKYEALIANMDDDSRQWIYFDKMNEIFDPKDKKVWPLNAINIFLTTYQRNLNRFENDENPQTIWKDIAKAVNSSVSPNFVTSAEVQAKMLELKDKYGKLMKDPAAAGQWIHFKRMASIFSCHLWSKLNVNILLDAYDENKHRFDLEDPQTIWYDIKNQFNARSSTSAVTESQCKTQMHVLKARYNALKSNVEPSNIFWPFYERMDQVFGEQSEKQETPQNEPTRSFNVEVEENDDVTMDESEAEIYEWTDDRITALLDAYEQHQDMFDTKLRKEVWAVIDKEIADNDPSYKEGVRGYGGWLQYMKLMNKYMDIKERRIDDDEWPFYDRLQKIFDNRRPGSKGISTASVASRDSIADKLQNLLTESPAKSPPKSPLKSPERKRKRDDSGSETNVSSVFSEEADSHSTPITRSKRNVMATGSKWWSEEDTIQLLEACIQNLDQLQPPNKSHASTWREIKRLITKKRPEFIKTIAECEEKLSQLKISYNKNKRFGSKLAQAKRMSSNVYKKMEEFLRADKEKKSNKTPKENGTSKPEAETLLEPETLPEPKTQIDKDLQQKILEQLQIQNEYRRTRDEFTKAYQEQALALQREKVDALNKILDAVNNFCSSKESSEKDQVAEDKLKELVKSLEEAIDD